MSSSPHLRPRSLPLAGSLLIGALFLLAGAAPLHAQSPADQAIMDTLRDDFGFDAAFGWPTDKPCCPPLDFNWPGVTCSDGRVAIIAVGGGNALPLQDTFPGAQFAGLTALVSLELRGAYYDPIAASQFAPIGGMTQLTKLRLDQNPGLTGTLADIFPGGLGGFSVLSIIQLEGTALTGPIPADAFATNRLTVLYQCRFTGTLTPTGPANHARAKLHGNQLEGVPPAWLRDDARTHVFSGGLFTPFSVPNTSLGYNKFDVANTPPCAMDTADPGWRDTQTVPPTNVQVTATTATTATLAWTPIGYQAHGGHYEVLTASQSGGPYISRGTTADSGGKTASDLTVTGLPAGQPLYFIVRTFTPAHVGGFVYTNGEVEPVGGTRNYVDNPNDLTSVNSAEVTASTAVAPTVSLSASKAEVLERLDVIGFAAPSNALTLTATASAPVDTAQTVTLSSPAPPPKTWTTP